MTTDYLVCRGALFVNGERVPVDKRVLRIGLAAAGLETTDCGRLGDRAARRILHLERSLLLDGLARELSRILASDRAA